MKITIFDSGDADWEQVKRQLDFWNCGYEVEVDLE